jgi:nucleotide-binding universal stress UspA family protein
MHRPDRRAAKAPEAMKRILVPTDFSEQAGYAFDLACQIAEVSKAQLVALHVLDYTGLFDFTAGTTAYPILGSPAGIDYDEKYLESLYGNAQEKLQKFLDQHAHRNIQIVPKIKLGSAFHYIIEEINEEATHLVVMGSKGSSGLEEMLIGSNTEKVVRHARCPVLTVKYPVELQKVRNIAFASNFTEAEAHVTEDLKKLQGVFNATLHLVRINTPGNFETHRNSMKMMKSFVEVNQIDHYTINIYNDKVEEDGIIYFAEDIDADMIALATHGRSGILHLLSGSIAEDVVNHARRPVWTFRLSR